MKSCRAFGKHSRVQRLPGVLLPVIFLISILILVLSPNALAQTDGQNGLPGVDGDPGTVGGNGGDGDSEFLTLDDVGVDEVNVSTEGGRGGNGGWGGDGLVDFMGPDLNADGGDGGNGGAGGNATSIAIATDVTGEAGIYSIAFGGDGGLGGFGGVPLGSTNMGQSGIEGLNGNGGMAIARSTLVNATGEGRHYVDAFAIGGDGAAYVSGGLAGGASASASGVAQSGDLDVSARATGGDGGGGGLFGSDGASVSLIQSVSGAAAGQLNLNVIAISGDGGSANGGGSAGEGGDAIAVQSDVTNTLGEYVSLDLDAVGGDGGNGGETLVGGSQAGNGGDAYVEGSASDTGTVILRVNAIAGDAGAFGYAPTGVDGGRASLGVVSGVSTNGGLVIVDATVRSGDAGEHASAAGSSYSVILDNAIDGDTTGSLTLEQSARSGNGSVFESGDNGTVGDASSTLSKIVSSERIELRTEATGGGGGRLTGSTVDANGAAGANADATSLSENLVGDAISRADARGGRGAHTGLARSGDGGHATAQASSVSGDQANQTLATALATGGASGNLGGDAGNAVDASTGQGGNALATAYAEGGNTGSISAVADAEGGNTSATLSLGSIAGQGIADAYAKGQGDATVSAASDARGGTGQGFVLDSNGEFATAIATAHAENTGTGNTSATAVQRASNRRYQPGAEGFGADSIMLNQATGTTHGRLVLRQESYAGSGTINGTGDRQGEGGYASSIFDLNDQSASEVVLFSEAVGGSGNGSGTEPAGEGGGGHAEAALIANGDATALVRSRGGTANPTAAFDCPPACSPSGRGGNAVGIATVNSQTGDAVALVEATAGTGFLREGGSNNRDVFAGTASAHAVAISELGNSSRSTTLAEGSDTNAFAQAITSGGSISSLEVGSNAITMPSENDVPFRVRAGATAGIGENALGSIDFQENSMRAVALPTASLISQSLNGNANVANVFDGSVNSSLYGATRVSGASEVGSGETTSTTIQTYVDFSINTGAQSVTQVYLAFLDPTLVGNGFESLSVSISIGDDLIIEEFFSDSTVAMEYFDDNVLDLGQWQTGPGSAFDFLIQFDAVIGSDSDEFSIDFIVGTVPLPGALWLFIASIASLGVVRRSKSA